MNPRTPFVAAILVSGVSLGLLVSFASSADAENELVNFRPESAAPGAEWVECGAGRYWSVHGERRSRVWTACEVRADTVREAASTPAPKLQCAATASGAYVDLGR